MKYFYPAICSYDQKKGMFFVMFPDLIGCEAKASTMNEAAKKAREALAASLLELEEKALPIPSATSERQLRFRESGKRICTFLVDMDGPIKRTKSDTQMRRAQNGLAKPEKDVARASSPKSSDSDKSDK